jgi:methyl-accepting chemotaxis protein
MAQAEQSHDALRAVIFRALTAAETGDETEKTAAEEERKTLSHTTIAALESLTASRLDPDTHETLSRIRPDVQSYLTKAADVINLTLSGQRQKALATLPSFHEAFTKASEGLQELGLLVRGGTSYSKAQSEDAANAATKNAVIVLATAIVLAIILSLVITFSITRPLRKMTFAATRIAQGDIAQNIDHTSKDEIGALATAFRDLIQYIQEIANAADTVSKGDLTIYLSPKSEYDVLSRSFAQMIERLREMNGKIQEGTHVLSDSIKKILESVSQVAASTTETATAVTQTATTISQVRYIAYNASDKAKEIAINGQQTAAVSQSGEQALEKAAQGMKRIREQMESIAESVIKLGEQSQTIGNIIDAVNEVAEQSTLLAVNAAIEAANAGEQGKGFAIVAREVKNLATQSRQATAEVRNILKEIQKAANVAVLVTEQGTKSVQVGVSQSIEAGESIRLLSRNITEAAQGVTQIAVSSQQQMLGIDQVAIAIEHVKQATSRNADGVQEIATAAHKLHTVGQTLKDLAEQYKLTTTNGTGH